VRLEDARHALGEPYVALDDERDRLLADRVGQHRHQDAHPKRREQRRGHGGRRPQPDGQIVTRHAPDRAHHRAPPFDSRPRVSVIAASAIATSTSRFAYTGSGVTLRPWNAHSSTPTA